MLEVTDVDFIRSCGVVVFAVFDCHLDLCCGEYYFDCLQFVCLLIYVSVCFMFDCVGELFVECVCYLCGSGQVGLGVGSWPSNRATEESNPKGTRLYFVILLNNVEKIFD